MISALYVMVLILKAVDRTLDVMVFVSAVHILTNAEHAMQIREQIVTLTPLLISVG